MKMYSHTGQVKFCNEDSRYLPLSTMREATSGANLNNIHQKKRKKPEIQIQMSKLDKISGALWKITYVGIMFSESRNSMFRRTISQYI